MLKFKKVFFNKDLALSQFVQLKKRNIEYNPCASQYKSKLLIWNKKWHGGQS